jgi:acetoin utilization protein AcuB
MSTKLRTADVRDSLETVRALLQRESFHHVPILDEKRLVGIISSRDLVRVYREARSDDVEGEEPSNSASPNVASTMQTDLVTMRSDESVEKAIDALADGAIHSVLVLNAHDELVGIATNIDVLEYLFD